jgi:outer membrane protein OmpA-like peptidoglycan-associated protein
MRILITGLIAFIIWSFFSTWLYTDVLRHAARKPVIVQPIPESKNNVADSLAKIYAMMPEDRSVCFGFDKAMLIPDPQLESALPDFKSWLDKYPESMLLVTGYTDLVGEPEYNQKLGLERAQAMQKFLENKGFPASRLIVSSKGEEDPVAGYITAEERAKNRRTVISIKKQ